MQILREINTLDNAELQYKTIRQPFFTFMLQRFPIRMANTHGVNFSIDHFKCTCPAAFHPHVYDSQKF